MSCLCKLLIAMGTSINVGHFLDQDGVVTVPPNGHWLNAYGFIVGRLPDKPPGVILAWFVNTNTKFKLLLNLFQFCELHSAQDLHLLVIAANKELLSQFCSLFCATVRPCPMVHSSAAKETHMLNVSSAYKPFLLRNQSGS